MAIDGEEVPSYQAAVAGLKAAPGDVLVTVERSTAAEAELAKETRRGGARGLRKAALGVRAAAQMQGSPLKGGSFLPRKGGSKSAPFAKLDSPARASPMKGLKKLDPLNVSGRLSGQFDKVSERLEKVSLKKLDPLNVSGKLGDQLDRLDGKLEKMRPSAKRASGIAAPAAAPAAAPEPEPPRPVDPQLELLDMDI